VETNEDACEGCCEPLTGRADRRFCSAACRQSAYRARRRDERNGRRLAELLARWEQFKSDHPIPAHDPALHRACTAGSRNAGGPDSRNAQRP